MRHHEFVCYKINLFCPQLFSLLKFFSYSYQFRQQVTGHELTLAEVSFNIGQDARSHKIINTPLCQQKKDNGFHFSLFKNIGLRGHISCFLEALRRAPSMWCSPKCPNTLNLEYYAHILMGQF
jgi:hypothetical protein